MRKIVINVNGGESLDDVFEWEQYWLMGPEPGDDVTILCHEGGHPDPKRKSKYMRK